jgi:hypothetical protein
LNRLGTTRIARAFAAEKARVPPAERKEHSMSEVHEDWESERRPEDEIPVDEPTFDSDPLDAYEHAPADRMPTPDEERAADEVADDRPDSVGENYEDMAKRGSA